VAVVLATFDCSDIMETFYRADQTLAMGQVYVTKVEWSNPKSVDTIVA
jgi:hypothetical protein